MKKSVFYLNPFSVLCSYPISSRKSKSAHCIALFSNLLIAMFLKEFLLLQEKQLTNLNILVEH